MTPESLTIFGGNNVCFDFDNTLTDPEEDENGIEGEKGDCELAMLALLSKYRDKFPGWVRCHPDFDLEQVLAENAEIEDLGAQYDHLDQALFMGLDNEDIRKFGRIISRKYDGRARWNARMLDTIIRARSSKANIFIVTASSQLLVATILNTSQIPYTAVVGKTFRYDWLRRIKAVKRSPRFAQKVTAVQPLLHGNPINVAFGDSQSDMPLLEAAQMGFLRNPKTGIFEPIK